MSTPDIDAFVSGLRVPSGGCPTEFSLRAFAAEAAPQADVRELVELVQELHADLANEIMARYGASGEHPALKPKRDRDMGVVFRAQAILAKHKELL